MPGDRSDQIPPRVPVQTPLHDRPQAIMADGSRVPVQQGPLSRSWILFLESLQAQQQGQAKGNNDTSVTRLDVQIPGASQTTPEFKGDHLSVKMFGCVPDSTADQGDGLQAAIDAAIETGSVLYIPPGLYSFGRMLTIKAPLTVYSAKQDYFPDQWAGPDTLSGARLRYTGSATAIRINAPITAKNPAGFNYRVHLTGFSLVTTTPYDPENPTNHLADKGLEIINCEECEFDHLEIQGFHSNIWISHLAISTIHHCQLTYAHDAIYVAPASGAAGGLYTSHLSSLNCFMCDGAVIHLANTISCWIDHNYAESCRYFLLIDNFDGPAEWNHVVVEQNHCNFGAALGDASPYDDEPRVFLARAGGPPENHIYVALTAIHDNVFNILAGKSRCLFEVHAGGSESVWVPGLDLQRNYLVGAGEGACSSDTAQFTVRSSDNDIRIGWADSPAPLMAPGSLGLAGTLDALGWTWKVSPSLQVDGTLTVNQQGQALSLVGKTGAAYASFFPDGDTSNQRGYVGYPNDGNDNIALENRWTGGLYLITNSADGGHIILNSAAARVSVGYAIHGASATLHVRDDRAGGIATLLVTPGAGQSPAGDGGTTYNPLLRVERADGTAVFVVDESGCYGTISTTAMIGPYTAGQVADAVTKVLAATSDPTPSTLMLRDASGTVKAVPGTAANCVATVDGAQTLTNKVIDGSANTITGVAPSGAAGGDLSGTYPNPTVSTVGGSTAALIHAAELLANAATHLPTVSTVVKRDSSGAAQFEALTMQGVAPGTFTGFLEFRKPDSTRLGYLQGNTADVSMVLENSAQFQLYGGAMFVTAPANTANAVVTTDGTQTLTNKSIDFADNTALNLPLKVGGTAGIGGVELLAGDSTLTGLIRWLRPDGTEMAKVQGSGSELDWIFSGVTAMMVRGASLYNDSPADSANAVLTTDGAQTLTEKTIDGSANTITNVAPSGAAGGDLSGTYPNPTVNATSAATASTVVKRDTTASVALQNLTLVGISPSTFTGLLEFRKPDTTRLAYLQGNTTDLYLVLENGAQFYISGGNVNATGGNFTGGKVTQTASPTTTTTTIGNKDARLLLINATGTANAGGEVVLGAVADTGLGRYAAIGTNIQANFSGQAAGDVYIATKASGDSTLTARLTVKSDGTVIIPGPGTAAHCVATIDATQTLTNKSLDGTQNTITNVAPSGAAGGDLSGTYPNPGVAKIGGSTAALVHSAELAANAAASVNTASTIMLRDANCATTVQTLTLKGVSPSTFCGLFEWRKSDSTRLGYMQGNATDIYLVLENSAKFYVSGAGLYLANPANTSQSAVSVDATQTLTNKTISGASNTITNVAPSGAAGGDLSGTYPNPTVATVGASTAANIHSAEQAANAATAANTASTLVKRSSGGSIQSTLDYQALGGAGLGLWKDTTSTSQRWRLITLTSEAGSNTGSDFYICRYDDASTYLGAPFAIIRSTGAIAMTTPQLAINPVATTTTTLGQKDSRILLMNTTSTLNAGGEVLLGISADTDLERWAAIGSNIKYRALNSDTPAHYESEGEVYIATKLHADTALTQRLTVNARGAVLIGTTTDDAVTADLLQVNGNVKATAAHLTTPTTDALSVATIDATQTLTNKALGTGCSGFPVTSVNTKTGAVTLSGTDFGLGTAAYQSGVTAGSVSIVNTCAAAFNTVTVKDGSGSNFALTYVSGLTLTTSTWSFSSGVRTT